MRLVIVVIVALLVLAITTPILALNKPAVVTSTYEVLEPETWIGKELPILKYIDIGEKLKTGTWLVLFYHYDCPDCQKAIPQYQQMANDLAGNEDLLRIAFIEIPPYGLGGLREDAAYALGHLAEVKEWFVTAPATTLTCEGKVKAVWEAKVPDFDAILAQIVTSHSGSKRVRTLVSTISLSPKRHLLLKEVIAMNKYPVGFR